MVDNRDLRIQRELDRISDDPSLPGISLFQDGDDFNHFLAIIHGPVSTPYEGGFFKVEIYLPEKYPVEPPQMRFITKIWHPNISHQTGAIRMSALTKDWTPTMGLKSVLIALQALLLEPDLSEPLEEDVAIHYRDCPHYFMSWARQCTEKYAKNCYPLPKTKISGTRISRMPKRLDDFVLGGVWD